MIVCTEKSLAILLLICIDIDTESFISTAVKIDVESACPGLKGGVSPSLVEEYKIVYIGKILKNVSQFRSKFYLE